MTANQATGEPMQVEQAPAPQQPAPRAPWWAAWLLALIPALGLGGRGTKLVERSDKQLELLTEIKATVGNQSEKLGDLKQRVDGIEDRERRKYDRDEKLDSWSGAALRKEGYEPPRGLDTDQVRLQSTRNSKRPVRPVEADGSALEVPAAPVPPALH